VEALQREQGKEEERLPAAEQAGQSGGGAGLVRGPDEQVGSDVGVEVLGVGVGVVTGVLVLPPAVAHADRRAGDPSGQLAGPAAAEDRKSTRLNSSHVKISYAVFCLKKKKKVRR